VVNCEQKVEFKTEKICMLAQIAEKYPDVSKTTVTELDSLINWYKTILTDGHSLGTLLDKRAEFVNKKNDILLIDEKHKTFIKIYTTVLNLLSNLDSNHHDINIDIEVNPMIGIQMMSQELSTICGSCDLVCTSYGSGIVIRSFKTELDEGYEVKKPM